MLFLCPNKSNLRIVLAIVLTLFSCSFTNADNTDGVLDIPVKGSVSIEEGLLAWQRIYEVASHPRCANCHVGDDNNPMWSGPSYGKARPHEMNINAGESRNGAEHIPCSSCHITTKEFGTIPHTPPGVGVAWAFAPVEMEWFGKTSPEICDQLKDPTRNGGRESYLGIVEHLQHDAELHGFVLWGWSPGGNRDPAPYSMKDHITDVLKWGVAGSPCPD